MTSPWTQEKLQHTIYEEVAAVVYAEIHQRPRSVAATQEPVTQQQASEHVARPLPTIVVGVDRSPASDTAVAWAAAEAVRRSGRLVLVQVEQLGDLPVPRDQWDEQERELAALAASARNAHPRLDDVTSELLAGTPGPVLVARADRADLLVVGTHGKRALSRAVLGSASAYCAVHATVPTVIVPQNWSSRQRVDD